MGPITKSRELRSFVGRVGPGRIDQTGELLINAGGEKIFGKKKGSKSATPRHGAVASLARGRRRKSSTWEYWAKVRWNDFSYGD